MSINPPPLCQGDNRPLPGPELLQLHAGVPGRGDGQGERGDDDLLSNRRTPKQLTPTHPGDPHEHWVGPEGGAEADFWVRTTGVFSQTWGRRDEPRASLDSRWSLGFPVHGDSWR